jgi:hypothetical protein
MMAIDTLETRAHELIGHLKPGKLAAVVHLLEVMVHDDDMLDPISRKLALAPIDDEPFTEGDRSAIAEADEWSKHNEPIPLENVLADFGLTMNDWETMAKTPLEEDGKRIA